MNPEQMEAFLTYKNTCDTKNRLNCYCYDNGVPDVEAVIHGVDGPYRYVKVGQKYRKELVG